MVVTALVVVGALGCAVWSLTLGSAGLGASGSLATSLGALAGGVLTGVVVYLFAYQRGVTGMRIIVVGIGVSLFLGAFNTWLLTTMRVERAIAAASWGSGSLSSPSRGSKPKWAKPAFISGLSGASTISLPPAG